jgi:gliding motility-associated-like protein
MQTNIKRRNWGWKALGPIFLLIILLPVFTRAQAPVADFSADVVSGCSPVSVSFKDLSTNNPTSWSWDFGNGTSSIKNPTVTYITPGVYNVKLTVTNSSGSATATKDSYITVYALPSVSFTATDTAGCAPLNAKFVDLLSAAGSGTITQWDWNFGDGSTSTEQNPNHTYTASGAFGVFLKVTNSNGCSQVASKSKFIKVSSTPKADFVPAVPLYCSFPVTVSFNNTTAGASNISYTWVFDDGKISNVVSPLRDYASAGSYSAILVAKTQAGCTDSIKKLFTLQPKSVSFSGPDSICVSAPGTYTITSNPTPSAISWDMGDGTKYSTPVANHVYKAAGTYNVKLIYSFTGCTDTVSKTVVVDPLPLVNFTSLDTVSCKAPLAVNFIEQSAGALKWQWNFGDSATSVNQNPSHIYNAPGKYTVSLTATDRNGCTGTKEKTAFIKIVSPSATITNLPANGCIPFTYSPTYSITSVDGVSSYFWNFGDGFTSTAPQPSHIYPSTGSYTITLAYTTTGGCKDTVTVSNGVMVGDKTSLDFTVDTTKICSSHLVYFAPVVNAAISSYLWNFGDNSTSTQQNPSHHYTDSGYYSVTLSVNVGGCVSSIKKDSIIRINVAIAKFDFVKSCTQRDSVAFFNTSLNATSVKWNFGDGGTSTNTNQTHIFKAPGNYLVTLIAYNGNCSDTIVKTVPIWFGKPTVTTSATAVCRGGQATISFKHPSPSYVTSYSWNFTGNPNDGFVTTSDSSISWSFNKNGTYGVLAYSLDAFGCTDTVRISKFINVTGPTARFGADHINGCAGTTINFIDSTLSDSARTIKEWTWNFGDSTTKTYTSFPFVHKYDSAGAFNVHLKVTDNAGCTDSIQKPALISLSQGKANFSLVDSFSCVGSSISFINQSAGDNLNYKWEFGDASSSILQNPTHIYASTGVYPVKLVIYAANGCTDSLTKPNYVIINNPKAKIGVSDSVAGCPPAELKFYDSSFYARSWNWTFDDGNMSSAQNPVNVFFLAGSYNVQLIVTSAGGCMDTAYKKIVITGPTGKLTYSPLQGCSPLPVAYKINSIAGAQKYTWDFGDGITTNTTDSAETHSYQTLGKYLPKVLVKDTRGCVVPYEGTDTIYVEKLKPTFGASGRNFCDTGTVVFTDSTVTIAAVTRTWYFGDGTTSNADNPVHQYRSPGTYSVKLVIKSSLGCTDSVSYPALIKVVKSPVASIVGSDSICSGAINFSALLSADTSKVTSWTWSFGNGNTSTLQTPPTQIFSAGTFANKLTLVNSSGCSSTVIKPLTVLANPVLQSTPDTTICEATKASLIASGGSSYAWSSTNPASLSCTTCSNPVVSPLVNSQYYIKATAVNGCFAYDTINVSVLKKYTLSATSGFNVCMGSSVQFKASGAPAYMWSPSTGLSAVNIPNPLATPLITTRYKVVGYDSLGCFTDSVIVTANVFNYPTVNIGPDISTTVGNVITLNPTVSSDVVTYSWSPTVDLSCSNCGSPTFVTRENRTYVLKVTNIGGCSASDTINIIVTCNGSSVFIPNTFSPNADGENDVFYPRGKGIYTIAAFRIFNRWGEVVFDKRNVAPNDASAGWNGTYKGRLAESGVYTYYIEVICNNNQLLKYLGNINLIQ